MKRTVITKEITMSPQQELEGHQCMCSQGTFHLKEAFGLYIATSHKTVQVKLCIVKISLRTTARTKFFRKYVVYPFKSNQQDEIIVSKYNISIRRKGDRSRTD